ncbi:MAG: T9SS type A sorting domain-containing protein [Candidatus Kapabacteria bacterium]|nr:T9SS type A sorting domain-containing protein [Ignavibacteriota bacterium]MCW5885585.1 T9SS type A sorting domain-containing protein [Candidatus Kapabacteria bacterium]
MKLFIMLFVLFSILFTSISECKEELKLINTRIEGQKRISNFLLIKTEKNDDLFKQGPRNLKYVRLDGVILNSNDFGNTWFKKNEVEIPVTIDDISIFPNPVKESINIVFSENESLKRDLKIFDLTGYLHYSDKLYFSEVTSLDLSFLPNGCYIIIISGVDKFFRFVKI